jgi:hypothetical protein
LLPRAPDFCGGLFGFGASVDSEISGSSGSSGTSGVFIVFGSSRVLGISIIFGISENSCLSFSEICGFLGDFHF